VGFSGFGQVAALISAYLGIVRPPDKARASPDVHAVLASVSAAPLGFTV
jgi:hypothetical protein